jgi:hypothetical protein
MGTLIFKSIMKMRGGNPYLFVSKARAGALKSGWKRPLPVRVRINGRPQTPWRINMMPVGDGGFYLYLHGDVRKASGTKVGDRVSAEVSFDPAYHGGPLHAMPSWFSAPLRRDPKALRAWIALIPSRKKEVLRYFSRLKSEDARARNLRKALHVLSGRKGRFMARSWSNGG